MLVGAPGAQSGILYGPLNSGPLLLTGLSIFDERRSIAPIMGFAALRFSNLLVVPDSNKHQ